VGTFRASVSAGEFGPVITLSGEVDITNAAELSELITGQLDDETQQLTIDVAGLDFADTAAIRVFLVAARRLRERGGGLVLLRPQRALARVLEILGAEEVVAIRGETEAGPEPEP
jgi:anti-sigma B factor antagonist